jgi:hypothetical protein
MGLDPKVCRELIDQENTMVNHRMNWFLLLQGFIFAAIAFAWEKGVALCIVFALVGVLSSLSVGLLLRCSIIAIKRLEELSCGDNEPVLGRGYAETPRIVRVLLPWHFLPYVFIAAWFTLVVIRIRGLS